MGQETKSFRIGQISDTHLLSSSFGDEAFDVMERFERTLEDVKRQHLDFLVFSGDLTEHSFKEEYESFFLKVAECGCPWTVIAGNHDRSKDIAKFSPVEIPIHNGKIYYRRNINGFAFFFLDSSTGEVSKDQLEWLSEETSKESGEVFLFMHHPPCLCGHRFMDARYALRNVEEVGRTLDGIKNLHSIFVGHYHSGMTIDRGAGQTVYVTPSTQMELDPESSTFKILSQTPGWRLIEYADGKLLTELRFIGSNKI